MAIIRVVLLAFLALFVLDAANADAPLSTKQPLGLAERISIGPTLFMFHRDFCAGGVCSSAEYRGIARKRDEKVVWQAPEGKVILRAYETDSGEVLVLLGDPARWDRPVDRVEIRFARLNLSSGALTATPYRYVVEARLPGVHSAYVGVRASTTERHANGNPKAVQQELIDASGRILASGPASAANEVLHDIPDECYSATVLWQFGFVGETEGEWTEIAYSGDRLRLPDAKADKAALKLWCDDAMQRVWATRDRKGRWTARFAETFTPLGPASFASADEALHAGAGPATMARKRADEGRRGDQWLQLALALNTEWTEERTKRNTADQARAREQAGKERESILARRKAEEQRMAESLRVASAAADERSRAELDAANREALRSKKHSCSYPSSLSPPELEACSDLQKRLLQPHEWQGWVWVNRDLLSIHRVQRPVEEALREKARFNPVAPDDDLIKTLTAIACLEPEAPAASSTPAGPGGMAAVLAFVQARQKACGHLVPASARECFCVFDPRNEYVAGSCRPKKFEARSGPTAAEIEKDRRFNACSRQVVSTFSRR